MIDRLLPARDWLFDYQQDDRGTSTSDDEAILRDIGTAAFGIRYPKDITPRKLLTGKVVK